MNLILYRCRSCPAEFEAVGTTPTDVDCPECGKQATWWKVMYNFVSDSDAGEGLQVLVKDRAWDFDSKHGCVSIGVEKAGRTPAQQEAIYKNVIAEHQRRAHERDSSLGRKDDNTFRKIGSIPRELFEMRRRQTGNPNYWQEEGARALVREGLYLGKR